jgi:hypothetical protein
MLNWSHTRDETFRECRRKYYYRYYGGTGGWTARAPEAVRHVYRLTQLTSFDQALGTAIHARARELAYAVLHEHPLPDLATLTERTRAELNQLYLRSRNLTEFLRRPREHPVLLSAYYGRGMSDTTVARIRGKMERCLSHLLESPIWTTLAGCPTNSAWLFDSPGSVQMADTAVWAVPDLVFTDPSGRPVIVDWKTGRVVRETALAQLGIYAWFVRDTLALPPPPDGYAGYAVELQSGDVWAFALGTAEIQAAEQRTRSSVAEMDGLLEDPHGDTTAQIGQFPLARRRARCPECNYWELCEPEMLASSISTQSPGAIGNGRASS